MENLTRPPAPEYIEDYLKRAAEHLIDPNETAVIEGEKYRVIDLVQSGRRRLYNRAYRNKNRETERARTAAWKDANPDKLKAQKTRASDRAYHRPFIAIDAEGQDFPRPGRTRQE